MTDNLSILLSAVLIKSDIVLSFTPLKANRNFLRCIILSRYFRMMVVPLFEKEFPLRFKSVRCGVDWKILAK